MKKVIFLAVMALTLAIFLPATTAQAGHWGVNIGVNIPPVSVYYGAGHPYGPRPYYRNYYYARPYDYYYFGPSYPGPYYRPYYNYPAPGYRYYYGSPRYRGWYGPRYYRR